MATKDTVVQELVVNTLTHKQFKAAQEAGTLSPYELYGTPDTSVRLPVLTPMWFDHITNDVSWLRADTFSWQSGDVYVAAYEHLAGDFEGATADTETIAGIEITYYSAQDGHKICLPDQEANVSALYEATGAADYYLLDTTNKQFKLPRKYRPKRELVRSEKNSDGTWYNLYSDNWVEQGGKADVGTDNASITVTLPIEISDTNAISLATEQTAAYSGEYDRGAVGAYLNSTTTVLIKHGRGSTTGTSWYVAGYAAGNIPETQKYLYFYVGNFEQDAVEQTAGINAEMFNSKADVDLGNIPANYDYVVETQLPTADNGYTWYRKYKSGWVEQGGLSSVGPSTSETKTLPIEMSDTNYTVISGLKRTTNSGSGHSSVGGAAVSTTQIKLIGDYNDGGTGSMQGAYWQVSGQAA